MKTWLQHQLVAFAVAVGTIAIALLLTLHLETPLTPCLDMLFLAAVAVSAGYGGLAFGGLTTLVSGLLINYLFGSPIHQLLPSEWEDTLRLGLFLLNGCIINLCINLRTRWAFGLDMPESGAENQCSQVEKALQQTSRDLETCITERTDELKQINLRLQQELLEHQQTEAAMQEFNRRWQSLLNSVQLAVVGLDHTGHVFYANPFLLRLTGYTPAEILGKNWFEHVIPPVQRQAAQTLFQEVLQQNLHPHYQNPILLKSGEECIISWCNTLLRDTGGTVIGTISIGEDVTKRQEIERMKHEFVSIISHELRTPLTAIRGSLGLLAAGVFEQKPEKSRRMLQVAAQQTDRLIGLVNDVLDLQRLESGKFLLKMQACHAADLIRKSVETVQASADESHIGLSVTAPCLQIWADPDAIVQTLTNLLSNAIKFSPPGSTIEVSATLSTREQSIGSREASAPRSLPTDPTPCILFTIKDQGCGIPPEQLETIFDRFQQVDASDARKKGGTGLGLAICRHIVQQHGGYIWAESILGEGSTFYFLLPIAPASKIRTISEL